MSWFSTVSLHSLDAHTPLLLHNSTSLCNLYPDVTQHPSGSRKRVIFTPFTSSLFPVILCLSLSLCCKLLVVETLHEVQAVLLNLLCDIPCLISELEGAENHWWCMWVYVQPSTPGTGLTGSAKTREQKKNQSGERISLFPSLVVTTALPFALRRPWRSWISSTKGW